MQSRNGSSNGHAPADPGFRAPWGELERQIPYVVITTQPWPTEWWRPPTERAAAAQRATAQPVDVLARPAAPAVIETLPDVPVGIQVWDTPAHLSSHEPASARLTASRTVSRPTARRKHRSQQERRGLFTRLAFVAVGLIVSLIAVETATRRRG